MSAFRIVFFAYADETDPMFCKFPSQPDEILNKKCVLVCSDYCEGQFSTRVFDQKYFNDTSSLLNLVSFLLAENTVCNKKIYSVHPNSVLLPLYRWAFIRNANAEPLNMAFISRNIYDLCELFFKPTILTVERRFAFSCSTVQNWLNFSTCSFNDNVIDNSVSVLQNLCLRL